MKRVLVFSLMICLMLIASIAWSNIIHVPDDYPTIQAGIDAASDGDTVLVADGTYTGDGNKNLDFKGKAITVKSENGAENCIIDCEGDGRGFYFHSQETEESVVSGFTIRNGNKNGNLDDARGGGIFCDSSSPTITDCIITGNTAEADGAGIHCTSSSSPKIKNCIITGNTAKYGGGGIYCWDSSPEITNCIITGNTANYNGGGIYCWDSSPEITNCIITGNTANYSGGGIYSWTDASPIITNCTIAGNTAKYSGGGIQCEDFSYPTITNCILWADSPNEIEDGSAAVTYSDIHGGYTGEGNIFSNPLFVNLDAGDYHLQAGSPCIDAGTPEGAPPGDREGKPRPVEGIDMGAYEFETFKKFTLNLHQGINIISTPLNMKANWKLSNLAQHIRDINLIISYDYEEGKFISYVPETTPEDAKSNVPVKCGEGYIVIMKTEKEVEFKGYDCGDEIIAASSFAAVLRQTKSPVPLIFNDRQKTSIFVVTGYAMNEETGEALDDVTVKIRNLRTGQTLQDTTGVWAGSGRYVVTFIASEKEFMTRATDKLEITAQDATQRLTIAPKIHILTPDELADWVLVMPLHLSLPKKSVLMQNYPNPFNPETWIPYHLATDSPVVIRIYNNKGQHIRAIELGYKKAGIYVTKDKAAYWDGKDNLGEKVASGVYFYTLQAGEFRATRKLVILNRWCVSVYDNVI